MQRPPEEPTFSNQLDEGGRAWFYLVGLVAAGAAAVTGWIYSYIVPSRDTVVVKDAQAFMTLLIIAWYLAMGAGGATVLMAVLCRLRVPMKHPLMSIVHGLLGLAWGVTWVFLMIAEISISNKNKACEDIAGDKMQDDRVIRTCYQGNYLNWIPTYAVTAVAFVQCLIWLGTCKHVLGQWRNKKKYERGGLGHLQISVNGRVLDAPPGRTERERNEQARAIADEVWNEMTAEREAWVQKQMDARDAVEKGVHGGSGAVVQQMPDLGSQAQAWRQA